MGFIIIYIIDTYYSVIILLILSVEVQEQDNKSHGERLGKLSLRLRGSSSKLVLLCPTQSFNQ